MTTEQQPKIPDHELLRCIGSGSYGEVWLARNVMGNYRAVKIVYRRTFENDRPFEREFNGIQKFEPISRTDNCQVDILHIGRHVASGILPDPAGAHARQDNNERKREIYNDKAVLLFSFVLLIFGMTLVPNAADHTNVSCGFLAKDTLPAPPTDRERSMRWQLRALNSTYVWSA